MGGKDAAARCYPGGGSSPARSTVMITCLDADCVIYLVEGHPVWEPKVAARLATLRAAGTVIAVSDLARTECLAGPLAKGDAVTLANYHTFFSSGTVQMLPLTAVVCEQAAHL